MATFFPVRDSVPVSISGMCDQFSKVAIQDIDFDKISCLKSVQNDAILQVHHMRKVECLSACDLKKLEQLGLKDHIRRPVLVNGEFGSRIGVTEFLSSQQAGFATDGFDDSAYLVSQVTNGIAQPSVYLGGLAAFYPFVAAGASGLSQEYETAQEALDGVHDAVKEQKALLLSLQKKLIKQGITLEKNIVIDSQFCLQKPKEIAKNVKKNVAYFVKLLEMRAYTREQNNAELASSAVDEKEDDIVTMNDQSDHIDDIDHMLVKILNATFALGILKEREYILKAERREAWCAAKGMRGMQRAMQLFMLDAVASIASFLTSSHASSVLSSVSTSIGSIGTGVMGIAQGLMMTAGMLKMKAGCLQFRDMRAMGKNIQTRLHVIQSVDVKAALQRKIRDDSQYRYWSMLQKVVPGASLAVGQALMLAWSVTSMACIISGVAAPVGVGMMLSLLVPGVILTLAASLPKIGLESLLGDAFDERFGAHDEDEYFDEVEYIKMLPSDTETLAQRANSIAGLLDRVDGMDLDEFKLMILAKEVGSVDTVREKCVSKDDGCLVYKQDADIDDSVRDKLIAENVISKKTEFDNLYKKLQKADRMEEFAAAVAKIKNGDLLFARKKVLCHVPLHDIFSRKNLNPLQWKNSRLFHSGLEREFKKSIYILRSLDDMFSADLASDKDANAKLQDEILDMAAQVLQDFARRRLRAELQVTQRVLASIITCQNTSGAT